MDERRKDPKPDDLKLIFIKQKLNPRPRVIYLLRFGHDEVKRGSIKKKKRVLLKK